MELCYYLGVFARAYWVQFRNGYLRNPAIGCALVFLVLFVPVLGVAVVRIAEELTAAAIHSPIAALLPQVPGGLVTMMLLATLLSGTTGALQSVFLANDLEPLLATPAPMRAVLLARLLVGSIVPLGLVVSICTVVLTGYGLALGYGPAYFVALPLLLALIACLPTGLGVILALLLIRIAPAGFTRDFVNVVSILLGVGGFALTQLLPRVGNEAVPLLGALNSSLLPSTWAGQALVAIGEGDWGDALPTSLAIVALSLGVLVGSLLLTEQQAANGIAEMAATRGGRRHRAARVAVAGTYSSGGARPRAVAVVILRRELRTYLRDTANLRPLLSSLFMGGWWFWGVLQGGSVFSGVGTNVLAALFIATLVAYHPGLSAISRESRSLWQLQSAPVSGADIALGKLVFVYLSYLVVGVPFMLFAGIVTGLDLASLVGGALSVALLGWGCSALLVNLAFRFPRLEWKTTDEQVRTAAWLLAIFCLGSYVLLGMLVTSLYLLVPAGPGQLVALLISLGLTTFVTWLLHQETLRTASSCLATIES
jgi:ABC-2 type transport system permease protein